MGVLFSLTSLHLWLIYYPKNIENGDQNYNAALRGLRRIGLLLHLQTNSDPMINLYSLGPRPFFFVSSS